MKRPASMSVDEKVDTDIIPFFDPHFHIWDVSEATTTGHDGKILFQPDGKDVYDKSSYEAEFDKLPDSLKFVGGAFIEAVSVCHVGLTGPSYTGFCLAEARYASDQLKTGGYVIAPTCALEQPDVKETLAELAKDPLVVGIRQIVNSKPDWPRNGNLGDLIDNPDWCAGFGELKTVGFSFDLQLNPHQYSKYAEFLAKHPDTTVIIDHLGSPTMKDLTENAEQYWTGMEALSKLPQTYVKISMLCYADPDWDKSEVVLAAIHRVIGLFGASRCMFASNYPVDKKDGWPADRLFSAFLEIAARYSPTERQDLFAGSARRAYRSVPVG
mmetsp:Transcript_131595/g.232568  ORF Transcript_131595/g.232568 Transcript_131595/m.232568 type:complete len:326 (-) Transcript_131595:69-1046(-)